MKFGEKLKNIFDSLGLSYDDISQATGLTKTEIYDIINNNTRISTDAIDSLSYLVGQDLYTLFANSLSDGDIFDFIDHVDKKNTNLDFDNDFELKVMADKINMLKKSGANPSKLDYLHREYNRLFIKNEIYNKGNYDKGISAAENYFYNIYDINIFEDDIERIHPTDARIVLLLVEALREKGQYEKGLKILFRLLACPSLNEIMQIKSVNLVADLFESLDQPRKSYHFAEIGIELSIKYNINTIMPDLLLWKSLAEVAMGMSSSRATIDMMVKSSSILRTERVIEKFNTIFKEKYGIDIMRPGGFKKDDLKDDSVTSK